MTEGYDPYNSADKGIKDEPLKFDPDKDHLNDARDDAAPLGEQWFDGGLGGAQPSEKASNREDRHRDMK